uniref:Uncharacterized protein n=1 Tax=Kalanchoe fedtschenkoi TaxID=63787 RepID=A0A7N0TSQ6_KALFE
MGICTSKPQGANRFATEEERGAAEDVKRSSIGPNAAAEVEAVKKSPFFPFYSPSPTHY